MVPFNFSLGLRMAGSSVNRLYFLLFEILLSVRVTAYNQCGNQATKYQSITITCREREPNNTSYIVPNPSNGEAVLYLPNNNEHCIIIVHDLLGRVVFTNETYNEKVDLELSGYHDGIYLVSMIRDDNYKEVFKMVIEK